MKKIFSTLITCAVAFAVSAQPAFTALKLTPGYPKQQQKITFEYNKDYSSLIKQPGLDIVVYQFNDKAFTVSEPVITKNGSLYTGSITVDSNTNLIAFSFASGDEKDINKSKGYIVPVYNSSNQPVTGYYLNASQLQNGYGEYLFGMQNDPAAGLAFLEEGLTKYPAFKSDPTYFSTYLGAVSRVKRKDAIPVIGEELMQFEKRGNLTEAGYNMLIGWYTRDKRKDKADSLTAAMKLAYPNGEWKKGEAGMVFAKEKDPAKKVSLYEDFIKQYPPTEANKAGVDNLRSQLANAYAAAKDYKNFQQWSS